MQNNSLCNLNLQAITKETKEFSDIIIKMLSKNPKERPSTN